MQRIFKLKSFWMVFVFSAFLLSAAILNLNKSFKSEVSVLVVPKNGISAISIGQIAENLEEISSSVSFLDRLEKSNPLIFGEKIKSMTVQEKKNFWEKKVRIERVGESGLIKIIVLDGQKSRAEKITDETVKNLVESAGIFYDLGDDVDIKIVDNQEAYPARPSSFLFLILKGIVFGFLLALFSFFLSFSIFGKNIEPSTGSDFSDSAEPKKNPETFRWPNKMVSPFKPTEEEMAWPIEKKFFGKKAAAPSNLPVAPEEPASSEATADKSTPTSSFAKATEDKKVMASKEKEDAVAPIIKEATPEEVKERLNKLLSGKL